MKIGVNALFLIPSRVGGAETYLVELMEAVLRGHPGVSLVFFTQLENDGLLRERFGRYPRASFCLLKFRASSRPVRILREQFELPLKAKACGIDLLFSPGYTAPYFSPCPQAVMIHDMQYKSFPEDMTWTGRAVLDLLVAFASRRCDAIMTGSGFAARELLKYTPVKEENLYIVPHGANRIFSGSLAPQVLDACLSKVPGLKKPYFLCVAYSFPHKNLPLLAEAFWELSDKIPHQLVLVGGEGLGEHVLRRELEKIPAGRVLRLRNLPLEQLAALYQGAEAFIFPSRYEGFGLPVLEALQSGTPVITTRCASIPEIAEESALYFKDTDKEDLKAKVLGFLSLPASEREALTLKGKECAENFSWETAAQKTVACFEETLQKSGKNVRRGKA
jgi:glycosyltransferase involved in cell wall biosynthesis